MPPAASRRRRARLLPSGPTYPADRRRFVECRALYRLYRVVRVRAGACAAADRRRWRGAGLPDVYCCATYADGTTSALKRAAGADMPPLVTSHRSIANTTECAQDVLAAWLSFCAIFAEAIRLCLVDFVCCRARPVAWMPLPLTMMATLRSGSKYAMPSARTSC